MDSDHPGERKEKSEKKGKSKRRETGGEYRGSTFELTALERGRGEGESEIKRSVFVGATNKPFQKEALHNGRTRW
jgi:hypothetical protein